MTQISGGEKKNLVFEIISARIQEENNERKYVIYNLQVRHLSGNDDLSPSVIERRYSHFLNLYNSLKIEYPELLVSIDFPKKVLIGNFDNGLISTRSIGFEALLKHITANSLLRNSKSLVIFLQEPEVTKAKELMKNKEFASAFPLLEALFLLLNKVFTDRSPAVILSLCRLIGCAALGGINCQKWAELALHRYEGVSDSDLLSLYVPVMEICIQIGFNKEDLQKRLLDLSKTGFAVNKNNSLLADVDNLERKMFTIGH